jgi:hypothetical protein
MKRNQEEMNPVKRSPFKDEAYFAGKRKPRYAAAVPVQEIPQHGPESGKISQSFALGALPFSTGF